MGNDGMKLSFSRCEIFLDLCGFDLALIWGCLIFKVPLEIVIIADSVTKAFFSSDTPSARDFAKV